MNKLELGKASTGRSHDFLSVDFDLYTDGDEEFKVELITLMICNLRELQWSLGMNSEVFKKVCHKTKSTMEILNYDILNGMIDDLNKTNATDRSLKGNLLNKLCDDIIKNLEAERSPE